MQQFKQGSTAVFLSNNYLHLEVKSVLVFATNTQTVQYKVTAIHGGETSIKKKCMKTKQSLSKRKPFNEQ